MEVKVCLADSNTFKYCEKLSSVVIPNSVTTIGTEAFAFCKGLASVTMGNGITSIENLSFNSCTSLASISIPNSVTSIGECAFWNCSSLTSVIIPNSVTVLEWGVFSDNASLASVTIPNSVTTIAEYAFQNCSSLASVNIPNSVTAIGERAFGNCSVLASIAVPNSVTAIGTEAFQNCGSLMSIDVDADNMDYCSIDGVLYSKDMTLIHTYPCGKSGDYVILDGVLTIGHSAFNGCTHLTSAVIPNSVTTINNFAFAGCTALKTLTIGSSVAEIAMLAFEDSHAITTIYSLNPTPPTVYYFPEFFHIRESCRLIVPTESVDAYKAADGWSMFENISGGVGTGICDVSSGNFASYLRVSGGDIVVTGFPETSAVNIYTADGVLLLSARGNDGTVTYRPTTAGIYIVRVGTQVVKVAVR